MSWMTVHLQVATPLFNDGDRGDAAIRVPSLRGAMRFWLRALIGAGVGNNVDALARIERLVFGDTDNTSPVRLRISRQPTPKPADTQPGWCNLDDDRGKWVAYLLGQGLSKPVKRPSGNGYDYVVTRAYVNSSEKFELQLRLGDDPDTATLAIAALWLLCAYGGLGARVRRGFGGLRILDVDADDSQLPGPWTTTTIRTPGVEHYAALSRMWPYDSVDGTAIGACQSAIERIAAAVKPNPVTLDLGAANTDTLPAYPMFSPRYTRAGLSGGTTAGGWSELLGRAGEQLRHFRATQPCPAAGYQPKIKTPEWGNVVHGPDTHFGLGALGLPINFKKVPSIVVHADHREGDEFVPLRRASPLWLRPVGSGGSWRLFSYAFQGEFLPAGTDVGVHLWTGGQDKALTVSHSDVVERTNTWIERIGAGETFTAQPSTPARNPSARTDRR